MARHTAVDVDGSTIEYTYYLWPIGIPTPRWWDDRIYAEKAWLWNLTPRWARVLDRILENRWVQMIRIRYHSANGAV